ncbi:CHASE domain-containing protein [Granulosicoccus antarcticus]|uniref:histidine kinase n=1 Tax=Granulosicoccus antarcticus IMCC3135 TaxID=1192854 RepID=A0A2Z2NXQ5_9GAMM|nr:CHASE domain-containing protein [Granulosicoccus antarcticus]ASJ72537.1 Phytochrome-like protein cph1 [Granulosicoccus antarcticus IMCC3135]
MTTITHQLRRLCCGWANALPVSALLVGITFTALVANSAYQALQEDRLAELELRAQNLMEEVEQIFSDQQYLLSSLRSLFDGSSNVSRLDFERYLDSIDMASNFPSAYAVAWYLRVPHHKLAEFEQIVRNDRSLDPRGYPDFKVHPQVDAPEHHVITYRYPSTENKHVFGFDLSSRNKRILSIERARDTASLTATAPLKLLNNGASDQGLLLMLPVYNINNPQSLQQRRQSYIGTLSGVFKVNVLMADSMQNEFTAIAIRDLTDVVREAPGAGFVQKGADKVLEPEPFYRTGISSESLTTLSSTIYVGGREWEFEMSMDAASMASLKDNTLCWIIVMIGLVSTVLASLGAANLTNARNKVVKQVESLASELSKANSDRERYSNDLSQFAYVASHDLNTPVRTVDMSVSLLEDALTNRMDPQVREYLTNLRDSAERMRVLVDDLQDFAQVERETLQWADLDLNAIVASVEQELMTELKDSDGTVTTGELPILRGDQKQLEKLFSNLLSNAIRFRHAQRAPQIHINACLVGSDWEVRVSDNGMGIDERFHEKIFEPFQRLHAGADSGGTGLGLGICKQIVECHDGELYVELSSDAGTTIVIRLPVREVVLKQAA